MSTPTQPMPGTGVRAEIARFVAAVERSLDDLPRDDAAELTDGLEADLTEAWAAEGVSPAQRFGSPESYAAELRAAAGLPARKRRGINGPVEMRAQWQRDREKLLRTLRDQPWWPQAVEYGHELRPAWWALRGVVLVGLVFYVVWVVLGIAPLGLVVLGFVPAAVWGALVSMRAGAAGSAAESRSRRLVAVANVVVLAVAVVGTLAYLSSLGGSQAGYQVYTDETQVPSTGLTANGEQVTNVFAYDADGKPLTRVRLYDQAGRPLTVDEGARSGYSEGDGDWLSRPDVGQSPQEWNLFPLLHASAQVDGSVPSPDKFGPVPAPYERLPELPPSAVDRPAPAEPKN